MTTLFPGAAWVPVPGQQNRGLRRKGRGVGLHVSVHEGPSIEKIDEGTGNDSHLYVRFDGSVEQNVDLDRISYAMVDGNATLITVETEGGVAHPAQGITADNQPWTAAQVATLARIVRWAHDTEGVPLQLMPDSKPASRGVAPHRLGIAPWRVAGGEVWSSSYAKTCPGTAKVAQIPSIVAAANSGGFLMSLTDAEQAELLDDVRNLKGFLYAGGASTVLAADGTLANSVAPSSVFGRVADIQLALTRALPALNADAQKTQDPAAMAAAVLGALPADLAHEVVAEMGKQLGQAANATSATT